MASDTDWGRLFGRPATKAAALAAIPPASEPPVLEPGAQLVALRELDHAGLQRHLDDMLDVLQLGGANIARDLHEDGSVAIKSMIAVFLLAEIAASVGHKRIATLSSVPRTDLESLAGLARLVARSLPTAPGSGS